MTIELAQLRGQFYNIANELFSQFDLLKAQESAPKNNFRYVTGTFRALLNEKILEQCECCSLHTYTPTSSCSPQNQRSCTLVISALLVPIRNLLANYYLTRVLSFADRLLNTIIENTTFPIRTLSGASLTVDDLLTVKTPEAWLNDEIINAQVALINARSATISIANTHFYSKVLTSGPYSVEAWLRPLLSQSTNIFVIPMNIHNAHWIACSIHLQGYFLLCFDSMSNVSTLVIKPILLLLLVHADLFGLTRGIIYERFVVLFPGYTRTFHELDEEDHILEELANIEARHAADMAPSLQGTGEDMNAISISSTGSDAERSSVHDTLGSRATVDSKSEQTSEKITFQWPGSTYYLRYRAGPAICGMSSPTGHTNIFPDSTVVTAKQDISTASTDTPASGTSPNMVVEIATTLTNPTLVALARQELENEGLAAISNSSLDELLFVDVRMAEIALHNLLKRHRIEGLLVSAAEAVMLSSNMPHQQNGWDCGVYMLLFVKMIARQFGPGYPLVAKDTKKARSLIALEVCTQKLLTTPQDLDGLY